MAYPWYQLVPDGQIEQGDLITDCPIVIPPKEYKKDGEYDVDVQEMNAIILSQSCDLVQRKIDIVLVCPYYPLTVYLNSMPVEQQSKKAKEKKIDELRKGYSPGYHLLNKDNGDNEQIKDYLLVDFRNVYGVQFDVLAHLVKQRHIRYRLLPPYREHLSQAFARYFMRVGLPQDISIEKEYLSTSK